MYCKQSIRDRFEFLFRRYNVDYRTNADVGRASVAALVPGRIVVAVQSGVYGAERNEAVAIQVARMQLGYLEEYPRTEKQRRKEWREAYRWAARALMPDFLMLQAEDEQLPDYALAEEALVTVEMARFRMVDWMNGGSSKAFDLLDLERLMLKYA